MMLSRVNCVRISACSGTRPNASMAPCTAGAARIVYRVWWAFLLVLFALGAIATPRREVWLLVAMAVLVSFAPSLFYVEGRHRLAVEPLLLPMAALSLTKGGTRWL